MENITKALQMQFREDKGKREGKAEGRESKIVRRIKTSFFLNLASLFLPSFFPVTSLNAELTSVSNKNIIMPWNRKS
jgi:hypothetical protein